MDSQNTLLEVKNLVISFDTSSGLFGGGKKSFNAVDDVSFTVKKGETVGLVGESGSGKTTIGRSIVSLVKPAKGEIFFGGARIDNLSRKDFMPFRKKIQMVFQDPFNSLNPKMSVFKIISEPLEIHFKNMTYAQRKDEVASLLETVGLKADFMERFPHEFSGGQRQRIGIARALAVKPQFLVCDEPVSALDVSVQASIINLLEDLKKNLGLSMLFIAHDLAVVEHISDRIMVMTKGRIVEQGAAEELVACPQHPYTKKLIASIPVF